MVTDPEIAAFRTSRRRRSLLTLAFILLVAIGAAVVWFLLRPGPCDALANETCASVGVARSTCSEFRKALVKLGATDPWCREVMKTIHAVPPELKSGVFTAALRDLVDELIARLKREGVEVPEQTRELRKLLSQSAGPG